MSCTRFRAGDRGQRYEVRALNAMGNEFVVGWCESADGDRLVEMVKKHPEWTEPRVIDRQSNEIN